MTYYIALALVCIGFLAVIGGVTSNRPRISFTGGMLQFLGAMLNLTT